VERNLQGDGFRTLFQGRGDSLVGLARSRRLAPRVAGRVTAAGVEELVKAVGVLGREKAVARALGVGAGEDWVGATVGRGAASGKMVEVGTMVAPGKTVAAVSVLAEPVRRMRAVEVLVEAVLAEPVRRMRAVEVLVEAVLVEAVLVEPDPRTRAAEVSAEAALVDPRMRAAEVSVEAALVELVLHMRAAGVDVAQAETGVIEPDQRKRAGGVCIVGEREGEGRLAGGWGVAVEAGPDCKFAAGYKMVAAGADKMVEAEAGKTVGAFETEVGTMVAVVEAGVDKMAEVAEVVADMKVEVAVV